jgi:UDP-N-acetylmuramate dehydrogenase
MKILRGIDLKNFSTFKVEAKAEYFVEASSEEDITELIQTEEFKNNKRYILGKGSNTLFKSDFNGIVVKVNIKGKEILSEDKEHILLKVCAGEDWTELVEWCVENSFLGIENLAWIPGTAGAAPVQNIGAYGKEISDVFEYLEAIEIGTGKRIRFNKDECEFGYRESVFKKEGQGKYIITSIVIKLYKTDNKIFLSNSPQYNSLKEELVNLHKEPYTLKEIYDSVVNLRIKKLPSIEEYGSAGSFFTNPLVSGKQLKEIQNTFPDIPYFETDETDILKLPTGWILEQLGWKGKRRGNVGTWPNHALIVVNYGNATGEEVLNFVKEIADDFEKKTGIVLKPEANII